MSVSPENQAAPNLCPNAWGAVVLAPAHSPLIGKHPCPATNETHLTSVISTQRPVSSTSSRAPGLTLCQHTQACRNASGMSNVLNAPSPGKPSLSSVLASSPRTSPAAEHPSVSAPAPHATHWPRLLLPSRPDQVPRWSLFRHRVLSLFSTSQIYDRLCA